MLGFINKILPEAVKKTVTNPTTHKPNTAIYPAFAAGVFWFLGWLNILPPEKLTVANQSMFVVFISALVMFAQTYIKPLFKGKMINPG